MRCFAALLADAKTEHFVVAVTDDLVELRQRTAQLAARQNAARRTSRPCSIDSNCSTIVRR